MAAERDVLRPGDPAYVLQAVGPAKAGTIVEDLGGGRFLVETDGERIAGPPAGRVRVVRARRFLLSEREARVRGVARVHGGRC